MTNLGFAIRTVAGFALMIGGAAQAQRISPTNTGAVDGSVYTLVGSTAGAIRHEDNKGPHRLMVRDFKVHLATTANPLVATAITDAFGRYYFHNIPGGVYQLCWGDPGWVAGCASPAITVNGNVNYPDAQAVVPAVGSKGGKTVGAVWGRVPLADHGSSWFRDNYFAPEHAAQVTAATVANVPISKVLTNTAGEYILTDIPYDTTRITARLDGGLKIAIVTGATLASGAPVDLALPNGRPLIDSVTVMNGKTSARDVPVGATLKVVAMARDPDGDPLTYEFKPAGADGTVASSSGNAAVWKLDANPGIKTMYVLISDGRGGYSEGSTSVHAGGSTAQISGKVVSGNAPVKGASIVINGLNFVGGADGAFTGKVRISNRYVVTASRMGFVPASAIYDRASAYQVFHLVPTVVVRGDASKPLRIVDERHRSNTPYRAAAAFEVDPAVLVNAKGEKVRGGLVGETANIDIANAEMPGDFGAITNGRQSNLISFGAVYAGVRDSAGNPLQIAKGGSATLTLPVPMNMPKPPAKIVIWTYNEKTGYWEDLGERGLLNAAHSAYVAKIVHLSVKNTDIEKTTASCIRILLDNIDRNVLKARISFVSGPTPFVQQPEFVLGDALNAVERLPQNDVVNIAILDATTSAPVGVAQLLDANQQVLAGNNVNTGPSTPDFWPPPPYANCVTTSVRLQVPSGPYTTIPFLTFYDGIGDLATTEGYYQALDPGLSHDGVGHWSGGTHDTLGNWWLQAGFDPVTGAAADEKHEAYLNYNDLGFGRDMHVRKDGSGNVFAYVTNYGNHDQSPANADLANTADKTLAIATVAMESRAVGGVTGKVISFWVYQGGSATGPLLNSADLDGFGQKFVPQLCQTCHGGTPYGPANVNSPTLLEYSLHASLGSAYAASLREFDTGSFRYPGGGSTPAAADVPIFNQLNGLVRDSGPAAPIVDLINGWDPGGPTNNPPNLSYSPAGWSTHTDLYQNVVAKSCRTCHVSFDTSTFGDVTWDSYNGFKNRHGTIQSFACGDSKFMPHALITYRNFWLNTPHAPTFLGSFSAGDWVSFGGCQ